MKIQLQNKGKNTGYFEFKAQSDNIAELVIYGDISSDKWWGNEIIPTEIKESLDNANGKDLNIYINSPGGDVFAGIAIYHLLKRYQGKKVVYIDGIAASIASIIAMAGDEIIIPKNSYLMIHRAWTFASGNINDFKKKIEILEKTDNNMVEIYKTKTFEKISEEEILELMNNETWMTGSEASNYFNVTVTEENQIAACIDGIISNKIPENLKKQIDLKNSINLENQIEKEKLKLKLKLGGLK